MTIYKNILALLALMLTLPVFAQTTNESARRDELERHSFPMYGGTWSYAVVHYLDFLIETSHERYPVYGLEITNNFEEPLICTGSLTFATGDPNGRTLKRVHSATVMLGVTLPVVTNSIWGPSGFDSGDGPPIASDASCQLKQAPPPLYLPNGCKVEPGLLSHYQYPLAAWTVLDSDVVTVEFFMPSKNKADLTDSERRWGVRPVDVRIIDSRSIQKLDSQTMEAMKKIRLHTTCPGRRYRLRFEYRAGACPRCWPDRNSIIVSMP